MDILDENKASSEVSDENKTSSENEIKLTKKDLRKAFFRWVFFAQTAQSFERLEGLGFANTMEPILKKLFKDPKEYKESLKRHLQFYNTEPMLGTIVPGIVVALEEQRANKKPVTSELIDSVKNSLMGPISGLSDSIIVGTYIPILLSIALSLSQDGSPLGAIFYAVTFMATMLIPVYWLFMRSYKLGINAANLILEGGIASKITRALGIVGLTTIGGVTAHFVSFPLKWVYESGEMKLSMQKVFDQIMPGIIPLIVVLIIYYLIDKKKWSVNKIMLGLFVIVSALVCVGIA